MKINHADPAPPPSLTGSGETTPRTHSPAARSALASELRSALQDVANTRRLPLREFPPDLASHIGSFGTRRDLLSLATAHRSIGVLVASAVPEARLRVAAERVTDLPGFRRVLGAAGTHTTSNAAEPGASPPATARQLAPAERSATLVALSRRIPMMPESASSAASSGLIAAARELNGVHPSSEVAGLLSTLHVLRGNPQHAARSGGNVRDIAVAHQITDPAALRTLEWNATTSLHRDSAGGHARAGGNVLAVAAEFGITSDQGILELENAQISSTYPASAGHQAMSGGDLATIAHQHGITTEHGLAGLQSVAALGAAMRSILNGEPAQDAIERLGITLDEFIPEAAIQMLRSLKARPGLKHQPSEDQRKRGG
jgi:hypothetical protein